MLNHVFVPNELICDEPGGEIDWTKIEPYIKQNFIYDEHLVDELEQYRAILAPYTEINPGGPMPTPPMELHQYYIATEAGRFPPPQEEEEEEEDDEEDVIYVPANSILLRYTVTDGSINDYLVLSRSQKYFQYEPTDGGYTHHWSLYDPNQDKVYLRPYGEWPISKRLLFTSSSLDVTNQITYCFSDGQSNNSVAPVYFTSDKVCTRLYLSKDSNDYIMTCPAHYTISTGTYGAHNIYLVLDSYCTLPSQFYVEVF